MSGDTTWFEGAVRPDHVRALLTRDVPQFASGDLHLLKCEISHLRSEPVDGYWSATYQLTVAEPRGGTDRVVVTHGILHPPGTPDPTWAGEAAPFGAAGWRWYLPEVRLELSLEQADAGLPGLALLTDPSAARPLLEGILRTSGAGYDDLTLADVVPHVTGFKPGLRCTVLCDLVYPAGSGQHWPKRVVAKLHHDDTGERAHRMMQALWSSPLGRSDHVALAEPLAYLPEWKLLMQGTVPGDRTVKDLLHAALLGEDDEASAALAEAIRMAGRGLAELHRCGVAADRSVTWPEELALLRKKHGKLVAVAPELATLTASVSERLEAAASATPPDPLVPAHHSFRPSEVLLADGRVGFIDFDKFCLAEPASDLATFTTKIRHMAMNKVHAGEDDDDEVLEDTIRTARISRTDAICSDFLAGYRQEASVTPERLALWEALELWSLTLSAAKKAKSARIDNCAFMLRNHMDRHGL